MHRDELGVDALVLLFLVGFRAPLPERARHEAEQADGHAHLAEHGEDAGSGERGLLALGLLGRRHLSRQSCGVGLRGACAAEVNRRAELGDLASWVAKV